MPEPQFVTLSTKFLIIPQLPTVLQGLEVSACELKRTPVACNVAVSTALSLQQLPREMSPASPPQHSVNAMDHMVVSNGCDTLHRHTNTRARARAQRKCTYMHTYMHYIALHYIALHCITLHCIALHCITYIHCIHYITLQYITLHYITLHYITLHDMTLQRYITLRYTTLRYVT